MEETAEEQLECSSTEMATAISEKPFVMVPFQWGRYITSSGYIFYTSPSGRVLLSIEEVISYLQEVDSCKCYYNTDLNFTEVFSFDNTYFSLMLPPSEPTNCPCEKFWSGSISNDWDKQLAIDRLTSFAKEYISKTQFQKELDSDNANQVLIYMINSSEIDFNLSANSTMEENCQLLSVLNGKNFIVSRSGHIFPREMNRSQLKHFTYELVSKTAFELNLPQEYVVVLSGKTDQAMEAKNPRKETNKTETEAIKQKPKRGRKKKILSKEDIEARIEKQKAYQMEYRQKQKLKFQAKKIPQTERVTRSKSSRISAVNNEGEKEQTVIKPKPKRKLTNKKYDKELKIETQNALKFLENQLMELCPATVAY